MDSTRIKAIEFMQKHIDSTYHDSTKKLINLMKSTKTLMNLIKSAKI